MDVIEGGRRSRVPRLSLAVVIIVALVAAVAVVALIASQQPAIVVTPSQPPDASPSLTAEISPEPSLAPTPARVVNAGSLTEGRFQHAATILPDGRVLITGGTATIGGPGGLTSTEIWDPLTNETTASGSTDPDVAHLTRTTQKAILLPDGRILIVPGGCFCRPMPSAPAEIWDPSTGVWRAIASLTITRTGHSATLLADRRVLIAGGGSPPFDGGPAAADAFIWDPVRETSTPTGSMATGRGYHIATRLADGRVLVLGGSSGGAEDLVTSAEVWDLTTGSFAVVPSLEGIRGAVGLTQFAAVTLADGRVLIVNESTATLWDPRDDSVTAAGSLIHPRSGSTVTLLADGRVLVVGGYQVLGPDAPVVPILEAELWDPAALGFEVAGSLSGPRNAHTTTALPDGRALIVGGAFGESGGTPLSLLEAWEPARG
jgi:WD40 repeat protein